MKALKTVFSYVTIPLIFLNQVYGDLPQTKPRPSPRPAAISRNPPSAPNAPSSRPTYFDTMKVGAENGDVSCQLELARCYIRYKDETQAVFWYQKAAENGQSIAGSELARLYEEERQAFENFQKFRNEV